MLQNNIQRFHPADAFQFFVKFFCNIKPQVVGHLAPCLIMVNGSIYNNSV